MMTTPNPALLPRPALFDVTTIAESAPVGADRAGRA